ncbi:TPA: helix-turn-helix domain-containing protein [Legionella pneumophila]|uniref:helix-turn-helix domain-containing protein n=1 Tax=Legionella pneumophila TaxID=446 RepID=UPI000517C0B5|nr:helix-turn-helix domain-containing protein [Legionella pneumophila]SNV20205.1 prophage regulatory protein [Legionella pneumophila]HAT8692467.1 helix-turn-helix domain-containing protein [Legionella pneumophila]HAU1215314.1 helix-turn-helix domain-containing protein [Legionella pneumophila]
MKDDIMLIKELAEYLKINEKTAYKYAAEGKIPAFKVGGAWRFRRDDIERFTKGQYVATPKSGIEEK